jgi:hypothetical protein
VVSEHFLGRHCGQIFFIFADFFSEKKKKRATTFQKISVYFCEKFAETGCIYMSSSQKNTQVEKTNRPKRILGSQDIEVLKSAIF